MYLVKPKNGQRVRHPDTKQVLDAAGVRVEKLNSYWSRREMDGSVEISEISEAAPKAKSESKKGGE